MIQFWIKIGENGFKRNMSGAEIFSMQKFLERGLTEPPQCDVDFSKVYPSTRAAQNASYYGHTGISLQHYNLV